MAPYFYNTISTFWMLFIDFFIKGKQTGKDRSQKVYWTGIIPITWRTNQSVYGQTLTFSLCLPMPVAPFKVTSFSLRPGLLWSVSTAINHVEALLYHHYYWYPRETRWGSEPVLCIGGPHALYFKRCNRTNECREVNLFFLRKQPWLLLSTCLFSPLWPLIIPLLRRGQLRATKVTPMENGRIGRVAAGHDYFCTTIPGSGCSRAVRVVR